MSNLIKSEWYRINHTKPTLRVTIMVLFGCVLISFLGGEMPSFTKSSVSQTGALAMYLSSMILATLIGGSYMKRTAFYEIMDGKSPYEIIFGKLTVYTPIALICFFIPIATLLFIFDGGVETVQFIVLFFIIYMKVFLSTILLTMIFKSVESIILVMIPIMAQMMILSFVQTKEPSMNMLSAVLEWLPMGQILGMTHELSFGLIVKVILSFLIQTLVMYILALIFYKKKWMIKTTII